MHAPAVVDRTEHCQLVPIDQFYGLVHSRSCGQQELAIATRGRGICTLAVFVHRLRC